MRTEGLDNKASCYIILRTRKFISKQGLAGSRLWLVPKLPVLSQADLYAFGTLLDLQPQQAWFGAADRTSIISSPLVMSVAAFVQSVDLASAFFFFVRVLCQTVYKL